MVRHPHNISCSLLSSQKFALYKMLSFKWYMCVIVLANALYYSRHHLLFAQAATTIVVDLSGKGSSRSIQAAIDSVPSGNKNWITIEIKKGIYRERVVIPYNKPFIFLKGEGKDTTFIVWNAHSPHPHETPTFISQADNVLAKDITFMNSYNSPPATNPNPRSVAVAAQIKGDKSAFYRCGFLGLQDTLWDDHGRHCYRSCTIEGAVDFIFGNAQSHYEDCTISVAAAALKGTPGYITAQGRNLSQETSGFVFMNCNVVGSGTTYLGRPWRYYARVLYYNTAMADIIVPLGWDPWSRVGNELDILTMGEYNCSGPGSRSSGRVKWEKRFTEREVAELTSVSFIDDNQGWLNKAFHIMGP